MSWIDGVVARVRLALRRRAAESRMDEEFGFHLEMETQRLMRERGLNAVEARRQAMASFGGVEKHKESLRDDRGLGWLGRLVDDLRHALRRLRARPASTALAISMLALGIGLTTAMATFVDALVIRRVPFENPEQLAMLGARGQRNGRSAFAWSVLRAWQSNPGFMFVEGVAGAKLVTAETPTGPRVQASATVTPGFFTMLGVLPSRGRLLVAEDGRAGTNDRVLVSEDIWPTLSGGREFVSGTPITVDTERVFVVGLIPRGIRFPTWNTTIWRAADAQAPPDALAGGDGFVHVYVRFAPNVPRADALALATRQADGLDPLIAGMNVLERPITRSEPDTFFKKAIPVVSASIALVFLVLCANVASLLLAQLSSRRREYGMCSALGAPRSRLVSEALLEGSVLVAGAVVVGVGLAWTLVAATRGILPEALLEGTLNTLDLDRRALAIAIAAGASATMVAGLLPAWIGTRVDPAAAMRGSGRATTETRAARLTTRALLISEIALTCVLLTGATVLVRSFVNIASTSRGLNVDGVVTTWVVLDKKAFPDSGGRRVVATAVEAAARGMPGVTTATLSLGTPPEGAYFHFGDNWRSDLPDARPLDLVVESYDVTPEFFSLYEIPLLRGRTFAAGDAEHAVIIGERLATLLWPGRDAVGHSFLFDDTRYDVIGVAGEIAYPSLDGDDKDRPEFYSQFEPGGGQFMVTLKCPAACPSLPEVQRRIASVATGIRTVSAEMPDATYRKELARPKAAALLGGLFAIIAVLTAAGGLFSVLSFGVNQRRRELGIRAALGASSPQLRRLVLLDGSKTTILGVAVGASSAWMLSRALTSLQYNVGRNDPETWIAVFGVITATALLASWLPARRAGQVDVVAMMREG